jgi:hypothetical protein
VSSEEDTSDMVEPNELTAEAASAEEAKVAVACSSATANGSGARSSAPSNTLHSCVPLRQREEASPHATAPKVVTASVTRSESTLYSCAALLR